MGIRIALCALLVVEVIELSFASAARADVKALGYLPGGISSGALGISGDGSTVVGASKNTAYVWRADTGLQTLGPLVGNPTYPLISANAVSYDGTVVVGTARVAGDEVLYHPFRWTQATGAVDLGVVPGDPFPSATGDAVSADGSVVVGQGFDSIARWTAATGMQKLASHPGDPGLVESGEGGALGVSYDGTVIGGLAISGPQYGFRWTAATGFVATDPSTDPDQPDSIVNAISGDGNVAVGTDNDAAFRWTPAGGLQLLTPIPGSFLTEAMAASADGSVIVGDYRTPQLQSAFIWTAANGMVDLRQYLLAHGVTDAADWSFSSATGVSADGTKIVGNGDGPSGESAYIATLPEPASVALLAISAIVLTARRGRSQA